MRVLVELLDREPIQNVLGTCIFEPDMVIFLCDKSDSSFFRESAVYRLIRHRKLKTVPRFYYFDASSPDAIERVLQAVVHDFPDCIFDFSGGRDLVLLVAGAFCEAHHIPGYYIDISRGKFTDIRGCGSLLKTFHIPIFSAEDIFTLTGASIHGYGHFSPDEFTPEFEKNALLIWELVIHNPRAWGSFVSWLQSLCSGIPSGVTTISGAYAPRENTSSPRLNETILHKLHEINVLTQLQITNNRITLTFQNQLYRKCLVNQGIWLELYCYYTAKATGWYDDVRTSIVVDWDGMNGKADNTKNEVDVFMVKGVVPVFVSCKMSLPQPLALSEIVVLARKFGGGLSRIVVVTAGRLGAEHKALQTRAEDLGILLLDRTVIEHGQLAYRLVGISY